MQSQWNCRYSGVVPKSVPEAGFWPCDDERHVATVWIPELPQLIRKSKKAPTEVGAFLLAVVPLLGIRPDRSGQKVRHLFPALKAESMEVLLPYPNVKSSNLPYN